MLKQPYASSVGYANITTCPFCGARAHQIKTSWWRRLIFGEKSRYCCRTCNRRFRQ